MHNKLLRFTTVALIMTVSGCKTISGINQGASSSNEELTRIVKELEKKTDIILAQQAEIAKLQKQNQDPNQDSKTDSTDTNTSQVIASSLEDSATSTSSSTESSSIASENLPSQSAASSEPLIPGIAELPNNPEPGQCYVHAWRPPVFETQVETVKIKDEEEVIEIVPAQYQTALETVLVQEATTRVEPVPAVYRSVSENIEVKPATRNWLISSQADAPVASEELLAEARNTGFNLQSSAVDGVCYHEHYYPAVYQSYSEQVLIREASEITEVIPAVFGDVEKQVEIEPAKETVVVVPAEYKAVTETIVDTPARNEWQQCGGEENQSLGQVMCFVEIPATYKTITKNVLVSPATTKVETIPAKYKTVIVRGVVQEAQEVTKKIPAQYAVVSKQRKVSDERYAWHVITGGTEPPRTRTGRMICFSETPAEYRTVVKQQLVTPASTRTVEIPAEYKQVEVQKLVKAEQTTTRTIPAQFQTVTREKLISSGRMEWRAILCEANQTSEIILDIQRALSIRGYALEKIDGKFGKNTLDALNRFQRDNDLPVDEHINIESLNALGISGAQ